MSSHDSDDKNHLQVRGKLEDLDASRRSSAAPTLRDTDPVVTHLGDASPVIEKKELYDDAAGVAAPTDTLIIDWDGPDDPQNPKKSVFEYFVCVCVYSQLLMWWLVGLYEGSGWQRSWLPHSRLYLLYHPV